MVEFVVWDHVMGVRFSPPRPIDVGVCRMARRRIANPYNAGSSPVTYSKIRLGSVAEPGLMHLT